MGAADGEAVIQQGRPTAPMFALSGPGRRICNLCGAVNDVAERQEPFRCAACDGVSTRLGFLTVTCHDLALTTGELSSRICKHTSDKGCDLRVVGLTTYRMGSE